MGLTKHYKTFFSKDVFYLYEYSNGIAAFRTQVIEDGFLSYYDIIAVIHDDSLGIMENEFGENFEYSIDDIFSHSDYISEINQHDVFTVKSDILFSNVQKQIHEKGL